MSEGTILGYEHHPTSSLKKSSNTEEVMKSSALAREKHALSARETLMDHEIKEDQHKEITEAIKKSLSMLYRTVDIELKEEDFPRLFLIPQKHKKKVEEIKNKLGSFGGASMAAIVYIKSKKLSLREISAIQHELNHGVGTVKLVNNHDNRVGYAQVGLSTVKPDSVNGYSMSGEVMEESTVSFFDRDFIMNSTQPDIVQARQNQAGKSGYYLGIKGVSLLQAFKGVKQNEKATKILQEAFELIDSSHDNESSGTSIKVVEQLISRAVIVDGPEGEQKMKRLLLRSRLLPVAKGKLVKYINLLYQYTAGDRKTQPARVLFHTKDNHYAVRQVVTYLKSSALQQDFEKNPPKL